MNVPTSEEVLLLLSKHEALTVLELSTALNLTKADIRYHLKKLINQRKIEKLDSSSGQRGRPARRYRVTPAFYNHNLGMLIDGLISVFPNKELMFLELVEYLSSEINIDQNLPFISRINAVIKKLNDLQYSARWETRFQGPVIYFDNCPYRQLIDKYPELCEMDRRVLSRCINLPINIQNTIGLNASSNCKFQIVVSQKVKSISE